MGLTRICALSDVVSDQILRVELADRPALAVALVDGAVVAFDDTCPHADESLSKGWIEDGRVVCAVHFAEFAIGTGEAFNAPVGCGMLTFYQVEIQGTEVFADLRA